MRVLLVSESSLILAVRKQLVVSLFPYGDVQTAHSVSRVEALTNNHFDLVISDFEMSDIHPKEWPGYLHTWFSDALHLVLFTDTKQVEPMHAMLLDRTVFVDANVSEIQLCNKLIAMKDLLAYKDTPAHA